MSSISNNTVSNDTSVTLLVSISRLIPFWIFTILISPSLCCYFFIFYRCFCRGILKKHIRTHAVFVMLVCSFLQVITELPTILSYLRYNTAPIQSDFFCKFWACQDYTFNVTILLLMAFTAVERYLLIFKSPFLLKHRMILHYLPIGFCLVYPISLYIYLIFFYPCNNQFTFNMITCGGPCYFYEPAISTFDQFTNLVLPVVVSTSACLTLLSHVLWQKSRMQQQQRWKKNRRLLIQLLYIVILYNLLWLPMVTCSTIMLFSPVPQLVLLQLSVNILPYGIYVVILICPFVSLMSLRELRIRQVAWLFRFTATEHSRRRTEPLRMVRGSILPVIIE